MGTVETLARWWDGAELWATGLSFPVQVTLALLIFVPVCAVVARVLDVVVVSVVNGRLVRRGQHRRRPPR